VETLAVQTHRSKKYLGKLLWFQRVSHCNEMSIFHQLFVTANILPSPIALAILESSPLLHETTIDMGMDILNLYMYSVNSLGNLCKHTTLRNTSAISLAVKRWAITMKWAYFVNYPLPLIFLQWSPLFHWTTLMIDLDMLNMDVLSELKGKLE